MRAGQIVKLLVCGVVTLSLASCGGGGGGDKGVSEDSASATRDFEINACGSIGLRIANGKECEASGFEGGSPVVRILTLREGDILGLCTGTKIAPRVVLTAAHCFPPGTLAAQVDSVFGSSAVEGLAIHPGLAINLEQTVLFNDIALVLTAEDLPVYQVPLLLSRAIAIGEEAIVAGFGDTEEEGAADPVIRGGNTYIENVTPNHLFSLYNDGNSSPCQGDSGGPIFVNGGDTLALAGVVSQTDPQVPVEEVGECQEGDVTLYTSTQSTDVLDFIFAVVGPLVDVR